MDTSRFFSAFGSSGSGGSTVNSGTQYEMAYYSDANTVDGNSKFGSDENTFSFRADGFGLTSTRFIDVVDNATGSQDTLFVQTSAVNASTTCITADNFANHSGNNYAIKARAVSSTADCIGLIATSGGTLNQIPTDLKASVYGHTYYHGYDNYGGYFHSNRAANSAQDHYGVYAEATEALNNFGVYGRSFSNDGGDNFSFTAKVDISAGTSTTNAGFYVTEMSASGGTMTNLYAFYSAGATGAGTITTAYGLYLTAHTSGTTKYGIYQDGANDINHLEGRVDIINAMRLPLSATPTMAVDGDFAIDTTVTDWSHGVLKYYDGEEMGVCAMPIAQFSSPTDKHVVTYNATNDELELVGTQEALIVAASDETTALTTGTGKLTFRMPYAMTVDEVRASVTTAPTGSVLTVDINESGTSILSTKITIDATEKTSTTAVTAPVISDSSLADDAEMTIDIDTIGSSVAGAGLKVYIIGRRT